MVWLKRREKGKENYERVGWNREAQTWRQNNKHRTEKRAAAAPRQEWQTWWANFISLQTRPLCLLSLAAACWRGARHDTTLAYSLLIPPLIGFPPLTLHFHLIHVYTVSQEQLLQPHVTIREFSFNISTGIISALTTLPSYTFFFNVFFHFCSLDIFPLSCFLYLNKTRVCCVNLAQLLHSGVALEAFFSQVS